ncbi:hypothetical protein OF83DRAFT_1169903 [Amylostereum chailletii]|nr:hypothetical protein OF83DRAFT_1169903 [Amylostereum chailletii]
MSTLRVQDFPVGQIPGWEAEQEKDDDDESRELQNVSHSYIVYTSLKQSRANWLTSTFPKFNSRRSGKASDVPVPPQHHAKPLGKCTLQVGPHIFSETSIYEVQYVSNPTTSQQSRPSTASSGTWQATTPQSNAPTPYVFQPPVAPTPLANAPPRASTPLVSSLAKDIFVTPALMEYVNHQAQTNLTLAHFITLAATGKATNEQMKTLGLLIKSLADQLAATAQHPQPVTSTLHGPSYLAPLYGNYAYAPYHYYPQYAQPAPPPPPPAPAPPPRAHDVILEFKEKPYDRWFFPRGISFCERTPSEGPPSEILVSAALPFPSAASLTQSPDIIPASEPEAPKEVVTFRFTNVTEAIWDVLLIWAGGHDKMIANRDVLSSIAKTAPPRLFLQHQLPEGDLLAQFQQAASSPYIMKPLKASSGDKSRRKRPPRKPAADKERKERNAPSTATPTTAPSAPSVPSAPLPLPSSEAATRIPVVHKRKRASSAKTFVAPPKIACHSCGQTDVPLFIGGRFCQVCKDSGKVPADLGIPPAPTGTPPSYHSNVARAHYPNAPMAPRQSGSALPPPSHSHPVTCASPIP